MTESTLYDINNANEIEKGVFHSKAVDDLHNVRPAIRPSGIPRLSSSLSQKNNQNCNLEDNHLKTKTLLSSSKAPKCVENIIKSPCQDSFISDFLISPSYSKRNSRDTAPFSLSTNTESRARVNAQSLNRYDRAVSEEHQGRKSIESSHSEMTNNSGSTGANSHVITSKIGSLANARYKPGGGNIKIVEKKVDFSNVEARCGSTKNIKHKPGGGDIEIINRRLDFSKVAEPKVNSMKNIKYQPQKGDVKIDDRKLEWNTNSKVGSLNNVKHKPGGGNIQIVNQPLPWLKYNKPNLPPEEIAKIHKKTLKDNSIETIGSPPQSYSNSQCSDHSR